MNIHGVTYPDYGKQILKHLVVHMNSQVSTLNGIKLLLLKSRDSLLRPINKQKARENLGIYVSILYMFSFASNKIKEGQE
jgi:hypothetical protein